MNLELLNRHIGAALYHQVEAAKHTPAPGYVRSSGPEPGTQLRSEPGTELGTERFLGNAT